MEADAVADADQLFRLTFADLSAYVWRRFPYPAAEDVIAETFATAAEKADKFPMDLDQARAWIFAIARNHLMHARRTAARRSQLECPLAGGAMTLPLIEPDAANAAIACLAALAAFTALSPRDRETLVAALCSDGAGERPAGLSEDAYESCLRRARQHLRVAMNELDAGG